MSNPAARPWDIRQRRLVRKLARFRRGFGGVCGVPAIAPLGCLLDDGEERDWDCPSGTLGGRCWAGPGGESARGCERERWSEM